jgi:uncharacterized repeat protein (TIGR01451 family)
MKLTAEAGFLLKSSLKISSGIILCFLVAAVISTVAAASDETRWEYAGKTVLHQGDNYSIEEYTIEVVDFDEEDCEVLLHIKKGDKLLSKAVLNATLDEYIYNDDIKINIYNTTDDPLSKDPTKWPDPRIHIEFSIKEQPRLYVIVKTDKSQYGPNDPEIHVVCEIINNASDIEDMDVRILTDGLQLVNERFNKQLNIIGNTTERLSGSLKVPQLSNEQTFNITIDLSWKDSNEIIRNISKTKTITVLPICALEIVKFAKNSAMDKYVPVRIDIENTGIVNLTVQITDTVPGDFKLLYDQDLNWHIDLKPKQKISYSYSLQPTKPGRFDLDPVIAQWTMKNNQYSTVSNTPQIIIDGAFIIINKTVISEHARIGDDVTVTLSALNSGNIPTTVYLTDRIPQGTRMISGNTTLKTVLGPDQTDSISYMIRINSSGNIILPSPVVETLSEDYSRVQILEMDVINVSSPLSIANGPEPTLGSCSSETSISGPPVFEIAFTLFIFVLFGILYYRI